MGYSNVGQLIRRGNEKYYDIGLIIKRIDAGKYEKLGSLGPDFRYWYTIRLICSKYRQWILKSSNIANMRNDVIIYIPDTQIRHMPHNTNSRK